MATNEKLKIAVLIRNFVSTGGAERYAVEVTRRLAVTHDLHVFAQAWSWHGKEALTFHKIPRPFRKPSWLNQILFSYFCKRSVGQDFDIIHSHERVTHFDILAISCPCFRTYITEEKRLWKKMYIWFMVALSPLRLAYLWLEKKQFTYDNERLLIASSEYIMKNVQMNYPLPRHAFRIAYSGVDSNLAFKQGNPTDRQMLRDKLGIPRDDLVILFVGTEFKRKGLDALLKGFATIVDSDLTLLIAGGGGGKMTEYVRLAKNLGIGNRTIFLGLVEDVETIYAASDIYVLPTLADPSPLAPLEAMASGLATILSNEHYNGTAEHIKHGEALILSDPRDPEEIAAAVRKLMDEAYRLELAEKGRRLAESVTWEKATEVTLAAYHDVLAQKRIHQ
jgi:UDP-glucose:(heptosyl)LPS alpha-1,3-glucosyltransferase